MRTIGELRNERIRPGLAQRAVAAEIAQRHGVQDLYAYGSVARGDAHADSDVEQLYDTVAIDAPKLAEALRPVVADFAD